MLQLGLIFFITLIFVIAERLWPGRNLPAAPGWYIRAALLNACQLGVVVLAGISWNRWMHGKCLMHIDGTLPPLAQGFVGWFIGTFVFYWWHIARHKVRFLWLGLHQIHHSASRIETVTAFYKHPAEIAINSIISSAIMFVLLGASVNGGSWYNVFAAIGEYFYHTNLKTPKWLGYLIQRPENHSIHHQFDVHDYNYGDIPLWDRLFRTFKEVDGFADRCGFLEGKEEKLGRMILFKDNY